MCQIKKKDEGHVTRVTGSKHIRAYLSLIANRSVYLSNTTHTCFNMLKYVYFTC